MRSVSLRNAHPKTKYPRQAAAEIIALLDANAPKFLGGAPDGELSIAILTDRAIAKIHADFLDDPTPTDVITFEGNPVLQTAGEICVSADTAAAFSQKHQKNFSEELTLYIVHGYLHLCGYDDLVPSKKRRMRAAEARAMTLLKRHNKIPALTSPLPKKVSPRGTRK